MLTAFLLLTGACISATAQSVFKGKAVDSSSRQGIGYVTVSLLRSDDSTITGGAIADSAGVFTLPVIPDGQLLRLAAIGYQTMYARFNGHFSSFIVGMAANSSLLNEVTVNGEKQPFQRMADRLVVQIAGSSIFKTSVNAFDILKKIPGLEITIEGNLLVSGRTTPVVFIDGRPVPMSTEELRNYLSTLLPDKIASIEVITNPSSRYDAEYKAIVDIKLKRDETLGWTGSLSSNVQQNAYTIADNNLLLAYKTSKWAYNLRLGYTAGDATYRYTALQHQANTNIMRTYTHRLTNSNDISYQLGADYDISPKQRLGISLRMFDGDHGIRTRNTLHTTDSSAAKLVSFINSNTASPAELRNHAANLYYTVTLPKARLEILGSLLNTGNRQQEDIQIRDIPTSTLQQYWKTKLDNTILIRMGQADYTRNVSTSRFSAGAKFTFTTTRNDMLYDTLTTGTAFKTDSSRTSNFRYDEYISAAYISYEGQRNKLSYSASLRAEHTYSRGLAIGTSQANTRNYLTWLPAVMLTYPLPGNRQLAFAYTRRTTRPNFTQLNPFRFYFSPLNYWVGNPDLKPSITNTLSITYTHKTFNLTLDAGRESDPMGRYPEYDPVTNELQYLGWNLPYHDFASLQTSIPATVNKWWRMSNNLSVYYKKEQTPYHGVTYALAIVDYTFNTNQVFTLPRSYTFDIYYAYHSPGGNNLYHIKAYSSLDFGLQKLWFKGKLNTRINAYDVFDNQKNQLVFREKSIIDNRFTHWVGAKRAALSISYQFGRSTHKVKQAGKNEEERRAAF